MLLEAARLLIEEKEEDIPLGTYFSHELYAISKPQTNLFYSRYLIVRTSSVRGYERGTREPCSPILEKRKRGRNNTAGNAHVYC